ncbi:hypothetical protein BGX33_004327, partial [Mortierella sp. NVP41]
IDEPLARQTIGEYLQIQRSKIAHIAREVQELRLNNFIRAKGLQPIPDKKKGVNIPADTINTSVKEAQEYARAMPNKKPNGGSGRGGRSGCGGRGWGNNNFHFGQQQQRPPYQQQQYQQQPYYQQYPPTHQAAPSPQQRTPFGYQPQGFNDGSRHPRRCIFTRTHRTRAGGS